MQPVRGRAAAHAARPLVLPNAIEMIQNAKAERRAGERAGLPICPFCCSTDTMEPFTRTARVAILSRVLPRLRRRYCRSCTRHFLMFMERVRPA